MMLIDHTSPTYRRTLAQATLSLVDAEVTLARARRHLHALQRAAVFGHGDDTALDRAVLAYRRAQSAADAAQATWRSRYRRDNGNAASHADEPSPHARFAHWLVEANRRPDARAA